MKTLGLVLALVALVGGSCLAASTTTATVNIVTGYWNMISLPLAPVDPAVGGNQTGQDHSGVFGQFNTKGTFTLEQYITSSGQYLTYHWQTPTVFGNLLLGVGYLVTGSAITGNISYTGYQDGVPDLDSNKNPVLDSAGYPICTDMYISLPGQGLGTGGWHLIGQPFNHTTAMNPSTSQKDGSRIVFTDGTTTYGWKDAVTAGWVVSTAKRYNPTAGSYTTVGYAYPSPNNAFNAGYAYWIATSKDNLAMIIPGMEIGQ